MRTMQSSRLESFGEWAQWIPVPWSRLVRLRLIQLAVGLGLLVTGGTRARAGAPPVIDLTGFVQVSGVPFEGQGQFKAAIVDSLGHSYWSHDGTSVAGSEPSNWIITNLVVRGRYVLNLGDTNIPGMTVPLDASVFVGPDTNLFLRVWFNDGVHGFERLLPDRRLVSVPYALHAATVSSNSIGSAHIMADAINGAHIADGTIASADLANNSVNSAHIVDGSVTSADVADGSLTLADFDLSGIDVRYVLKSGDTMTGLLTVPKLRATDALVTSLITNVTGVLSLRSRTDIELQLDLGGGANASFEIFNGVGAHLYSLAETGTARVFGNQVIDGTLGVGTTTLDANATVQVNLPTSSSVPHVRIKSPLGDNGFGLQFVNPDERWYVGPNIGNWSDDRFCILSDGSNKGLIIATNGNVGIDSVSSAAPFATLTVDGTIGFPTVSTPAMYIYPSGTVNAEKRLIVHSPAHPEWGMYYADVGDRFSFKSDATDTTPSLVIDLDGNWVAIATDTPKPGYELSVNGQIVCEELLVQNSANWPDYVFADDYPLRPLEEVESHVRENRHLPGIPAAGEVAKDGISIGSMQKQMMEKIEELTLYLIEQNKRLQAQDERIRQLESQLGHQAPASR